MVPVCSFNKLLVLVKPSISELANIDKCLQIPNNLSLSQLLEKWHSFTLSVFWYMFLPTIETVEAITRFLKQHSGNCFCLDEMAGYTWIPNLPT